ncbi:MAG: SPFH domain-containing protein [Armatimonadota bacterium]|nr:SPFH domain-containing protein [Armatimonadota bacterium]
MNLLIGMVYDVGTLGIVLGALALLAYVVVHIVFRWITVQPWEQVVAARGREVRVLEPGKHRIRSDARITTVDTRPYTQNLAGQEIPTTDGIAARYWMYADFRVADARKYVLETQSVYESLYRAMQTALRAAVRADRVEAILADAKAVENRISEPLRADAERVGVEVVAVRLLDVQLPNDLRKAAAGIELERRVGQVALERARGEIATLRALANAAHMIDENPNLAALRRLQVLEAALAAPNRAIAVHVGEAGV